MKRITPSMLTSLALDLRNGWSIGTFGAIGDPIMFRMIGSASPHVLTGWRSSPNAVPYALVPANPCMPLRGTLSSEKADAGGIAWRYAARYN